MSKEDADEFLYWLGFIDKTETLLSGWLDGLSPTARGSISDHDQVRLHDLVDSLLSEAAVRASDPGMVAKFWYEHTVVEPTSAPESTD